MPSPTLAEVRALAEGHDLVPLYETFVDDTQTPVSAFLKLRAAHPAQPSFLLESAEQGRVGRFSFLGVRPRTVLRWSLGQAGDPYALAQAELARRRTPVEVPGLELPFAGGAVGCFAYDLVRTVEPLGEPNPDPLGLPDLALMFTDSLVLLQPNMNRERFEAIVARIIEYIHAGDAFQVVPSQRWSGPTPVEAFSIYRGLRAVNPSPYMYFLDFGDFEIAGASPEPLITVAGRRVATRPVAGTRPRGGTVEEDERIAAELLADEKERAEHVMLVDLGRNDLGRVCEYGSVQVESFMAVENYSHVMHIVYQVSGRLRDGVGALDALRSVLPAGTLSGAPKVRAMQIIDELEPIKRGGYGGAIGYASYTGELDTCIHIRTVVVKDGVAHVQAGGGTVADARPDLEYLESVAKSRAVMEAIALAVRQPDWP